MADACLGGEVDDVGRSMGGAKGPHVAPVADVALDDFDALRKEDFDALFLKLRVVIRVEMIETDDKIAARFEKMGEMEADKTGRAGDQNPFQNSLVLIKKLMLYKVARTRSHFKGGKS